MKNLILIVAVLFTSLTSFAQSQNNGKKTIGSSEIPFVVSMHNLDRYLGLSHSQFNTVKDINDYFIELQHKCTKSGPELQEEQIHQAVYANLKLLKKTLTPYQYKQYLVLLNITNYNRKRENGEIVHETYLSSNM